jgi:hypothetical protein
MSTQPNVYISNLQVQQFTVTPVLDTAIHATSDVLFVPTLFPVVATAQDMRRVRVEIMDITVIDRGNVKANFDIVFCTTSPASFGALNAAVAISDADAAACVRKLVPVTAYTELAAASNAIAMPAVTPFVIEVPTGATGFYIAGISRGTGTYAASDLVITIGVKFQNIPQA